MLALAAERKDEAFVTSLAAAWDEATENEHAEANAIWRELREHYADAVALPKAQRRYRQEVAQITGSRVGMPGHVSIWTRALGRVDVAWFKTEMQERADRTPRRRHARRSACAMTIRFLARTQRRGASRYRRNDRRG